MKLLTLSVTNFRSITVANKIPVKDLTILIGKNNEGKSNLLRALNYAMKALVTHGREDEMYRRRLRNDHAFVWKRDFPISLQNRSQSLESIFKLEFILSGDEVSEFKNLMRCSINSLLPLTITIGKNNIPEIRIPKKGPAAKAWADKSKKIAQYIAERINFNYIPAIRTDSEAMNVVEGMLFDKLWDLEKDQEYMKAIKKIEELQRPILTEVSESIKKSLEYFLPNIKKVAVQISQAERLGAFHKSCKIEIDDGTPTLLEYKGDGVKSLAALGLLKDSAKRKHASIIAIEEPESHLHPGAIHSLRSVITAISKEHQVIITTHCPVFVDRANISSNIIIDSSSAKVARSIDLIRATLGVMASDNLVNASNVLVVEGSEDIIALTAVLTHLSQTIARALKHHRIVIEKIGGAGNLAYRLNTLTNALCMYHVVLDHDDAGRKAYTRAVSDHVLDVNQVTFIRIDGMDNSEFEDCLNISVYERQVLSEFGVNLSNINTIKGRVWSERAGLIFKNQGKPWDDGIEMRLKSIVAKAVAENPAEALNERLSSPIIALKNTLERMLSGN